MAQITNITSGQLIDQNLISQLISAVNDISDGQYSSKSAIGESDASTTYSSLQNGQWIVNTGNTVSTSTALTANKIVTVTDSITFQNKFKTGTKPIVTATVYSTAGSGANIQTAMSSIIVTATSDTGFNFLVNIFSPTDQGYTSLRVEYIAIGQAPI